MMCDNMNSFRAAELSQEASSITEKELTNVWKDSPTKLTNNDRKIASF
jgi:hypothetical protein